MSELNDQQRRFVDEYVVDLNATAAAVRAGYSPHYSASRLMRMAHVRAAIDAALEARSERTQITADWVLEQMVEIYEDCRNGVVRREVQADGTVVEIRGFDASSALKALDMIAKYKAMTPPEKHEFTGADGGPILTKDLSPNEAARRVAFMLAKGLRAQQSRTGVDGFDENDPLLH